MLYSRKILIGWLAFFASLGLFAGLTGMKDPRVIDLAGVLCCTVLTYAWCRAEARERRQPVPSGFTMFATLVPPLGLPVYFARTRRPFGQAVLATLKAFGFYVGATALLYATEAVAFLVRS